VKPVVFCFLHLFFGLKANLSSSTVRRVNDEAFELTIALDGQATRSPLSHRMSRW
jgi:hypothetical protein